MMGFMMLFWVVVVVAVVWLVYRLTTQAQRGPTESAERPEDILRSRFARGEIDAETYHRTMDELTQSR